MTWFDALLGFAMIAAAAAVFFSKDLFRAVVMFVAFGLLLALAWVRMEAPDLALAEAAIGAGLTGVLFLDTVGYLRKAGKNRVKRKIPPLRITASAIAALISGVAIVAALLQRKEPDVNLPQQVANALPESGIDHPITAVLLNFRSYDTLLEVAVLLVAVVISLALANKAEHETLQQKPDPMLQGLVRRLLPLILIVGVYVLWAGSYYPGGAFQAGALIAAAGVLARLAGYDLASRENILLKTGLALGFLMFLAVAFSVMLGGRPFLDYPDEFTKPLILLIESVLTFSIALTLLSLFIQVPHQSERSSGGQS